MLAWFGKEPVMKYIQSFQKYPGGRSTLLTQTHTCDKHRVQINNNFDEKAKNRKLLTFVFFGLSTNISITKQNEIYYDVRNICQMNIVLPSNEFINKLLVL